MRRLFVSLLLILSFMTIPVVLPSSVSADVAAGCDESSSFLGFPTWYRYLDIGEKDGDPCAVTGPLNEEGDLDWRSAGALVGIAVVEILLRISTIIAVGFVMYGGFRYITSQGEPENTKSARQTIINSLIGLVVSLIATGLVAFIASQLTS
jgi:hypothetical protein